MISRRELFFGGAGLAALAALPKVARADRWTSNLVIVHAYGGWDTTYLMDPKPRSSRVDTPAGRWRQHGELELWQAPGMEASHEFLATWADRIAILNGVAVNSLVHEECARRILTGTSARALADIGARVADLAGRDLPLPYHVHGGGARVHGLEPIAGTSGYGNQLSSLVVPEMAYPTAEAPLQPSGRESRLVDAYLEARAEGLGAQVGGLGAAPGRVSDYVESLVRARELEDSASRNLLSDWDLFYGFDAYERAAHVLADGLSKCVFLTDDGYWDTHFDNDEQPRLYNGLFGRLSTLMETLEDNRIADDTVVMVVSEMGRSPLLNGNAGKDHWPYTSAMLIGPSVLSGIVRGTDEGLQQRPVDLETGLAHEGGRAMQVQDLLATVTALVGLDAAALYPEGEVVRAVVA